MTKLNINTTGNRKLKNTETVRFMIWNLPAVKTCPFRTELCERSCYARKAERVYPQVLPSRERNFADSLSSGFTDSMICTIEDEITKKKYTGKTVVFRIHESGDFYSPEYFEKWVDIARYFEGEYNIVFLAYTKSITYAINSGYGLPGFPKNFVIRSSLWKDTKQDKIDLTQVYKLPIYTALTRAEMDAETDAGHTFTECRCSDCATCGKCWDASEKDIICEIH